MSGKSTKLSREEFDSLCSGFTGEHAERNRLFAAIGFFVGYRVSEICSLTVGDVTDESGLVNGRIIARRKTMKGKRTGRSMPINEALKVLIENYLKTRKNPSPASPLLLSERGGHMTRQAASRLFKTAANRVGLGNSVSTHSLRKTFAHNVLKRGENNVLIVQRALGHRSLTTTLAYLDCSQDEVDSAIMAIQ